MHLSSWPSPQSSEQRGHSERLRSLWQQASGKLQFADSLFDKIPPPLGLFTDSSGLSCGGLDPVFLQAFLLSAVPSFLHNCQSWTLAFHFIFIWLLPQLPIFEHFAYYQSGSSCTLLSSILLIGSSVGPTFPKTVNSPRTQSLPRIQHSPQAPRAGATFPLRKVLASLTEWV